jgi:hypothetical protein
LKIRQFFLHVPKTAGTSISRAFGNPSNHLFYADFNTDLPAFGIVRNPIERFISAYNYVKYEPVRGVYKNFLIRFKNINEFIQNSEFWKLEHMRPQSDWLDDCTYIGKFDEVQNFINFITKKFKLEKIELQHIRAAKEKEKTRLTAKSKKILLEIYQKDLNYYENCFSYNKFGRLRQHSRIN